MARFLVDAQLSPALARWLASQGHTAEHVNDVGLDGADDRRIWDQALRAITADTDLRLCRFFGLSNGWWLHLQADYD